MDNKPNLKSSGSGRKVLIAPYTLGSVTVPRGMVTDGFSVPWWLAWIRWLFFLPVSVRDLFDPWGTCLGAAVVHDHVCGMLESDLEHAVKENSIRALHQWWKDRRTADYHFYEDLRRLGATNRKCKKFYSAVCVGTDAIGYKAMAKIAF